MAITKPLKWNVKSMPSEIIWQILKMEIEDKNSSMENIKALGIVLGKAKFLELVHKKDFTAYVPPENLEEFEQRK